MNKVIIAYKMKCVICSNELDNGSSVTRVGKIGLVSLVNASEIRRDGLVQAFNSAQDLRVHSDCRKNYTHPSALEKIKRAFEDEDGEFYCSFHIFMFRP